MRHVIDSFRKVGKKFIFSIPVMSSINQVLFNPAYHDYLAILKGARNGLVYGVKIRFPHALVMAILFGHGE